MANLPAIPNGEIQALASFPTPAGEVSIRLVTDGKTFVDNVQSALTMWVSDARLTWKRNQDEPFGMMISSLDMEFSVRQAGYFAWPDALQNPEYGRWRVEVFLNTHMLWHGFLLPLGLSFSEFDSLKFVRATFGDGLNSLKSFTLPYVNRDVITDLWTWLPNLINQAGIKHPQISSFYLSESGWILKDAGNYENEINTIRFLPYGFIDPKTGEWPTFFDAIQMMARRFMCTFFSGQGQFQMSDLLWQYPTYVSNLRDDAEFSQADFVNKITIKNPIEIPLKIVYSSDANFAEWVNDEDYLSKWQAPWTLNDNGSVNSAKYIQVIERLPDDMGVHQINLADGDAEQKALLEQVAFPLTLEDGLILVIQGKGFSRWNRRSYKPTPPFWQTTSYIDAFEYRIKCNEWYYDVAQSEWTTTEVNNTSPANGESFQVVITHLPEKPGDLVLQILDPPGDIDLTLPTNPGDPDVITCSGNEIRYFGAFVTRADNYYRLVEKPDDLQLSISSDDTNFVVKSDRVYEFLHSSKQYNPSYNNQGGNYYPRAMTLMSAQNAQPLASIYRLDYPGVLPSINMDEVWAKVFLARYGTDKPIRFCETTFLKKFLTPGDVISTGSMTLRLPAELEWDLFAGTTKGRWEVDPN